MTYKDLEDSQLHHRKLTFHCMEEVLRQSRPTIESTEVNKHRRFEMKHPGVSIYQTKEMLDLKEKEEVHESEKRTLMKIFKSIFNKREIEKKTFEKDIVKLRHNLMLLIRLKDYHYSRHQKIIARTRNLISWLRKKNVEISNQHYHCQMLMNLAVDLMINLAVNQRMMTILAVDLMMNPVAILMMNLIDNHSL